jgi:hypothetical protein
MSVTRSFLALVVVLLVPAAARAYIDPGSGSLVFQGIIAAVLGVGVAIRLFWQRIKARLTGRRRPDPDRDAHD